ncbi:MAG: hypothetical protein L0332_34460 [Chloroflexi bacterium]|nr:hypothetical protein [Chloroflexota bacterium]
MSPRGSKPLQAPFPSFGGKSAAAALVWSRLGSVRNFVEPFANSAAVLLANPDYDWQRGRWLVQKPPIETLNDANCFISNFYRAVVADPERVAYWASWPAIEVDVHARHRWLVDHAKAGFAERMLADPDFCDYKAAGWWAWGASAWIGPDWCRLDVEPGQQRPYLSSRGQGVLASGRRDDLPGYLAALAARLRDVRVACGDWSRVVGPSVTWNNNCARGRDAYIAIFMDPPYSAEAGRDAGLYPNDDLAVAHQVREWCLAEIEDKAAGFRGPRCYHPRLLLALAGYEREHGPHMPADWQCVAWQPNGGMANRNTSNRNKDQERLWFSPNCLRPETPAEAGQLVLGPAAEETPDV